MKTFTKQHLIPALMCLLFAAAWISCKKDSPAPVPVTVVPVITNVQPKTPAPGDVVTITGTGFGANATDVKVTIGTQVIIITSVTNTEIKFTLPPGITAGDIAVAIKNVIANNTDPQKATITPKPATVPAATITAINPTAGKVGDAVTITGTNFSATPTDDVVNFNGVAATVTTATATTLAVTVPANATTGIVSVSVKGAAAVNGSSFTVNAATTGGTGTAVPYIVTVSGKATFSKIASATSEIGAMVVDKKNNVLYYSDYSAFAAAHGGTLYKVKLDGSAAAVVSTDTRIHNVVNIAADATGNVYVIAAQDQFGIKADIYKIDPGTGAVTDVVKDLPYGGSGDTFNVDSQGGLWLGYGQKVNVTTAKLDRNSTFPYGSSHNAFFQGDDVYVDDANHLPNDNIGFYKYNLVTKAGSATDFTLQGLFKQDNAAMGTGTSYLDVQSKYALDNSENFYAMYPIAGDVTSSANDYYVIRKTKNGAGGASTLITKFYTKFHSDGLPLVFYQQARLNTGILFQADATGNLYMKDNKTDIIKVTQ